MRPMYSAAIAAFATLAIAADAPSWEAKLKAAVPVVASIGHEGTQSERASAAMRELASLPPEAIPALLAAMKSNNPLAMNLMRSAVETIAERAQTAGKPLPRRELEAFVLDRQNSPRARRFAYELLSRSDPSARERLISAFLADPSPELRRDAVAHHIAQAEALKTSGSAKEAQAGFEKAFSGAIDDDQVRTLTKALEEFGVKVDLQQHFGFITRWSMIGPFDNRGMRGFAASYPPEERVDLAAKYEGQLGEVTWKPVETDDPYGSIDVAKLAQNHKGSAMYFVADYQAAQAGPAEIRLGTPNAWKLWLNGKYLFGREEYHRGEELDQYRVPITLEPGENQILLKLLQNEQDDDWAQDYKVRLRVCDAAGQALLPVPATSE